MKTPLRRSTEHTQVVAGAWAYHRPAVSAAVGGRPPPSGVVIDVVLEAEPDNRDDPNAIRVADSGGATLGYLPYYVAARVSCDEPLRSTAKVMPDMVMAVVSVPPEPPDDTIGDDLRASLMQDLRASLRQTGLTDEDIDARFAQP